MTREKLEIAAENAKLLEKEPVALDVEEDYYYSFWPLVTGMKQAILEIIPCLADNEEELKRLAAKAAMVVLQEVNFE